MSVWVLASFLTKIVALVEKLFGKEWVGKVGLALLSEH